jgi:hypothetical protein
VTSLAAHSFLVVCEGPSDPETIMVLADRVACAEHDWLDGIIDSMRIWTGVTPGDTCVYWSDIYRICDARGVPRAHGVGYALGRRSALMALRLARTLDVSPTAVLLIRDSDGDHDGWLASLEAARRDFHAREQSPRFMVVIGVAHPEREAWVLASFEPRTPEERSRLDELRAELGFNPCEQGERLTSKREVHKRDAKRVLARLTSGDRDRELAGFRETALETLSARGERIGLCAFLGEVRERLACCYVKA